MIDTIARRAAARLGPSLDPSLPAYLERAIAAEGRTDRQRSFDAGVREDNLVTFDGWNTEGQSGQGRRSGLDPC